MPAGYASTNNPVESFNSIIKKFFTLRYKENLLQSLETFKYNLEGYEHKNFSTEPKVIKKCIISGKELIRSRVRFLKKKNTKKTSFDYTSKLNIKYKIVINELFINNPIETHCRCEYFSHLKAYCKHICMACIYLDLNLNGLEVIEKYSIRNTHRQKTKSSKALSFE